MDSFFDRYFAQGLSTGLQTIVVALLILLIGWLVAKIVGNVVESGLRKLKVDERFLDKFQTGEKKYNINKILGKVVYYILLVIAFMLFFNHLNLTMIASPLSDLVSTFFDIIPAVLKAALILVFAWVIATVLRWLVVKGTEKAKFQDLLFKFKVAKTKEDITRLMETIGKVVFYVVLLLFIPGVLDALSITGVAQPFSGLLDTTLAFIPKLIGAALIFAVGWFIAKIIKTIIVNLLQAVRSEALIKRLKLEKLFEGTSFEAFVGNLVFIIIMIPITISSLEKLDLIGISQPAISMLNEVMNMIPNILLAVAIILVGIWLGKLIGGFVQEYLGRLGFNRLLAKMNIETTEASNNKMTPSAVAGYVVQVLIIFILAVQALHLIKLDFLVDIASVVTAYIPNVLASVLILGAALILANIVEKVLVNLLNGPATKILAGFAKYAILVLSGFMALTQLGIATTIVSAAFVLILGGLALAFGLAFGLGGKEFASKHLERLDQTIEKTNVSKDNDQ